MLVIGLAASLMAVQLVTDIVVETRHSRAQGLADARSATSLFARNFEKQLANFQFHELEELLVPLRADQKVIDAFVTNKERTVFLDGVSDTQISDVPEITLQYNLALENGDARYRVSGRTITGIEPILQNGDVAGSVMLKFWNPEFATIAGPVVLSNLYFSAPILLLGVLLSTLLVRQITGPLRRLSDAAIAVAAGDLDSTVPIDGPKEIQQLGIEFSSMLTKLKQNIEQVYELAFVDKMTKLPNREFFRKELTRAINRSIRQDHTGALLFVDLDEFKRVNDTHGHDIGDELLGQFSDRLANALRAEDLIAFEASQAMSEEQPDDLDLKVKNQQMLARLGGDEFTVLLSEIREATDAAAVSKRIIDAVSEPFVMNGSEIRIGASVGIAIFPRDGSDYQTILKNADMAMYQAKEEGKNTYRYFSEDLNLEASRRMIIERDLRAALKNGNQLELYYQPKIDLRTGKPRSVEALIRWKHPEKGMIQPLEFIKVAEGCGLILPLGKWILAQACEQINRFSDQGMDIAIAVNISTAQFSGADLSKLIKDVLDESGANPARLELELTESMAMQNPERALYHIKVLKELGIRFAIDDFGTGYSNLSQLSQLPFDVFKIDRTFVDMLTNDQEEHGRVIVRTILAMANSLNYETVAEGVETLEQLELLTDFGCDFAQGYHFAKPMPEHEFINWYQEWLMQDLGKLTQPMSKSAVV